MSFDLKLIRDDLYRKLDVEHPGNAPLYIRQDVVQAINQALQTMQLAGPDYFMAESLALSLTIGQGVYSLPADIQRVTGYLRLDGGPHLRQLHSKSEYDGYGMFYLGALTMEIPAGEPRAYYVDSHRAPSGEDSVAITLYVVPVPVAAGAILMDVVKEPTHYDADDFCDDPTPVVPIPHKYVETLLLPLARFYITRSHWFHNAELLPKLEQDYQSALRFLGLADPEPSVARKTKTLLEDAAS